MTPACADGHAVSAEAAEGCSRRLRAGAALPGRPHMPGPAGLVAPLLLALQQLLVGAAACGRVRTPRPLLLLLGLGPVPGCARDFHQFTLNLLEPAALLIALVGQNPAKFHRPRQSFDAVRFLTTGLQLPACGGQRPPGDRGGGRQQPAAGRGALGAHAGAGRCQRRCIAGCDDAGCRLIERGQRQGLQRSGH